MNLNKFCYCSKTCLLLFALLISTFICLNESHEIKTEESNDSQSNQFVISSPQYSTTQNQEKEMINSYLSMLEERLKNYKFLEPLERLRRSASLLPYETLSGTPSRRSASHPCRWKLCGAHFGYHSMRRF